MQFAGKAMHKKAEVLSGGEKALLALAKFMLIFRHSVCADQHSSAGAATRGNLHYGVGNFWTHRKSQV